MSKPITIKDIQNLYTDPEVPGSLTAIPTFYKSLKEYFREDGSALKGWTLERVVAAIKNIPAYSLFKQPHRPKRKTRYAQVVTSGVNSQWQADLIEFPVDFARSNKGFRFLLVVIDVFSKRAYTQAIKRKEGKLVADAFELMFKDVIPRKIQTDAGKEFYNSYVQDLFKKHHITHFTTQNTEKAQIVERLNRTLKERFERIRQLNQNDDWINNYKAVTSSYNKTQNTAHGFTPDNVGPENTHIVRNKLYHGTGRYPMRVEEAAIKAAPVSAKTKGKKRIVTRIIPVGAYVRINKKKGLFEKGSTRLWTTQVFRVTGIIKGTIPLRYTIQYLDGEEVLGSFYQRELQEIDLPKEWAVRKVRTDKKTRKVLVTFNSIPDKQEWVSAGQLRQDKKTQRWWYIPKGAGRFLGKFKDEF